MKKVLSTVLALLLALLPVVSCAETTEELDAAYDAALVLVDEGKYDEAYAELLKLTEQGYGHALYAIGYYLDLGTFNGGTRDCAAASEWWLKGAEIGETKSMQALGHYYAHDAESVDFVKAEEWLLKAAEGGLSGAMYNLGNHYANGDFNNGVADYARALEWYLMGAEAGADGAVNQAIEYLGNGVAGADGEMLLAPDHEKLYTFLTAAYEKGSEKTTVMDWLGWMYAGNSEIVQADFPRAMEIYMAGAEMGSGYSMAQIGAMYRDARLGIADQVAAAAWFTKAVEAGYEPAQEMLDALNVE